MADGKNTAIVVKYGPQVVSLIVSKLKAWRARKKDQKRASAE